MVVALAAGLGGALFPHLRGNRSNSPFKFVCVICDNLAGTPDDEVVDVGGFSRQPQPGRLGTRFFVGFPVADVPRAVVVLNFIRLSAIAAANHRSPVDVEKLDLREFDDLGDGHVVLIFFEHSSSFRR